MDFVVPLFLLAVAAFSLCSLLTGIKNRTRSHPPQPDGALPFIGHMLILRDGRPLAQTMASLADKYGPVFMLRMGQKPTLIVSNSDAARECFTTNDEVFATRPLNPVGKLMGYDFGMMGFAPYGSYWRGIRKLTAMELLSKSRLANLKQVRAEEIGMCIRHLHRHLENRNGKDRQMPITVDMKQWMGNVTFNVVVKIVAGKRYFDDVAGGFSEQGWVFRKAISRFFRLMKTPVLSDMLPFLRWLNLKGQESAMKDAFRDIDDVVSLWLQEHRRHSGDDLMDVILSIINESDEYSTVSSMHNPDTVVKAVCMSLILGATDTTTNSLTLTLASIVNRPNVLKKIQEELDFHVGHRSFVEESDIDNLVYLQAVVKETFRLHPTSEFLQPHESMKDCQVAGYHIPAGTRLLVNVWKLQRDPTVWVDPLEFRPERFLTTHKHVHVRGRQFELIPFGSGRRSCPGISFALHVMHLTLSRLLHEFSISTVTGQPVEMSPGLGSTLDPTPLELQLTPRL